MMSCKEAARLLSLKRDGKLPWYRYPSLWLHTTLCSWCKCYGDRVEFLGRLMQCCDDASNQDDIKLSKDARARIHKACCCDENKDKPSSDDPR